MILMKRFFVLSLMAALVAGLAGCTSGTPSDSDKLDVVVAFYPLEYVTSTVGGDRTTVTNLTQPGTEPHDLELTPQQVATLSRADLVIYLGGFQPQVDDAIAQASPANVLDVSTVVSLLTDAETGEAGDSSATDPHVWLDPTNMEKITAAVTKTLSTLRVKDAAVFASNGEALTTNLKALDYDFSSGLASCARKEFIVTHAAFGYLAHRYGLQQIGISGISPDSDPSPARIAEVHQLAKKYGITTIFFETLASPEVANSIAGDLNLKTAVLDPLEGLTDESAGDDYIGVMRSNLAALEAANGC